MNSFQAVVLGIIQGLTEFLPISSTAHLRVIPAWLGWADPGAAFTAVIQGGTLLAVLIYFEKDIRRLLFAWLNGLRSGSPCGTADAKLAWMIIAGTIPLVLCGILFKNHIEGTWRSLYVISAAAILFALLLLAAEWFLQWRLKSNKPLKDFPDLGWLDAMIVGCAQALSLVPGASRSGVTITGGLFAGMNRETAARFSFLLSLPSLFAAGVYELYKERDVLLRSQADAVNLLLATVVSGIVGYASIAFLLAYLRTRTTYVFIVYRLLLGGLLLILLWQGVLSP
jgi:undecaprenyl-diphosphatase